MNVPDIISNWSWFDFCGKESFVAWNLKNSDLDICFQYLALEIPILVVITILSAYYNGVLYLHVRRCSRDLWVLGIRCMVTLMLAATPVVHIYLEETSFPGQLHSVDYLLAAIEGFSWLTHLSYLLALRHRLGQSMRGPVLMGVFWSIYYILAWIRLHSLNILRKDARSNLLSSDIPLIFAGIQVGLQTVYLLTLIPVGRDMPQVRFHSLVQRSGSEDRPPVFGMYSQFRDDQDQSYLGTPMDGYSILGRLFFSWVNPLMVRGSAGKLESADDLFELPASLTSPYLSLKVTDALHSRPGQISLLKALHACFWKQFYCIGLLKFTSDVMGFCGPLLLNGLISFIEEKNQPVYYGYIYAAALCLTSLIGALCNSQFNFRMSIVSLKMRGAMVSMIYRKTLSLAHINVSKLSTGEIVNYMSTDMDRIVNSCASFHALWSIPFQIIVALYLLYLQVSISFLAGVFFTILLIPVNRYLAKQIQKLSTLLMSRKDERILTMTEILKGIKTIKVNVWETFFIGKIDGIRKEEMKYLAGRKYLDALCVYFWATTPLLISIFTFLTFSLTGNVLTASVVFTTIALLNMLISPLNSFPWVLNGVTEAFVSIKRVEKLLKLPDFEAPDYYDPLPQKDYFKIENGHFSWGDPHFELKSINLEAHKGQLIGIIGQVGSGKSSLLEAFLGELNKTSGSVSYNDYEQGFGFVSQVPWLQRGSIQHNILFGEPLSPQKYWSVINACALERDIESLPGRDNFNVGDGGTALSGGQKARVALARAVYKDMSLYLLDDILSAVDPHVAQHIFHHCICGLLKQKTRILVTHQANFLVNAHHVVVLENGRIIRQGLPSDVLPNYVDHVTDQELGVSVESSESPPLPKQEPKEFISQNKEERQATGTLDWNVFTTYFFSVGLCLWPLIILTISLMQGSRNLADWWLSYWVSNSNTTTDYTTEYYIKVYVGIAVLNTIFTLLRAFLFAYGGLSAAKTIHNMLLHKVIKAKSVFFDLCSSGHVLNRFSSDVCTIDDSLPFIFNILLACFFNVLGSIFMTIFGLPYICLVLAPLVPLYHHLQSRYRHTSRDLKRISSITLSPLYSHFSETIQGLMTIRAFRSSLRFKSDNTIWLEANQKAQLCSSAVAQWLSIRLQLIGVIMVTGVGTLAALQHHFVFAQPGLIGLALSYALTFTGSLGGMINAITETERELVSVERVNQYLEECHEGLEGEVQTSLISPPFGWPTQGVVSFSNVYFKYGQHLPYSLSDVSFTTYPAERVGIVGRTGAGKTSILSVLFRLGEISEGTITIDSVNIKFLSLSDLRSRLGIIPQDPFVFTGSVRINLSPEGNHSDGELNNVLMKTHMLKVIQNLGGLDTVIKPESLSVGQRQLLCLARAILHNAKIICIDEATANVDEETDRLIQQTIRSSFRLSTVITVAHRVRTVIDCDRVMVMGDGQILEFDTPNNLLRTPSSKFYQLANENYQ